MQVKQLFISSLIVLIFFCNFVLASNSYENILNNNPEELETVKIKVGILSGDKLIVSRTEYFVDMFTDYNWISGDKKYEFEVKLLVDKDIFRGKLTTDDYDLIVVPGGGVGDGECVYRSLPTLYNHKWKRNFAQFIKDGGGYYSVCGGSAFITELDREPKSFLEYSYHRSSLGVSAIKSHYESASIPLFNRLCGLPPEYVGEAAYVMCSGWNLSDYYINYITGWCPDCPIVKNHPIFDDFHEDYRKIRWLGGPSLVLPDNPDREISVLAYFPDEELSENESTRIHAWKYVGGIPGIINAFVKNFKNNYQSATFGNLANVYPFIGDWAKTNEIIQTNFSNKPAMTAEIYPNENQARIVLTGLHPEYNIFWGGHIEEAVDDDNNNLWEGLHRYVDIKEKKEELEWKYNYWINRRSVAWVSKVVNDNDLPPIYGTSQICDIYPYNKNSNFQINGVSENSEGEISLQLFYRFSTDNLSFSDWTLLDVDNNINDGCSWDFDAPDGAGFYQFYSIRKVEYQGYLEIEDAPTGPDAMVHMIE